MDSFSEAGDVAPLCCSFIEAAFVLCQHKLKLHRSVYLESTVAKWSHNAFALANSGLEACKPKLYLENMVALGGAKDHVITAHTKDTPRLPDAGLLSWCPSNGFAQFPTCVRQGTLVACEFKKRLFPSEWTKDRVVAHVQNRTITGDLAVALDQSARDAAGRLLWVDPMGKLPYCYSVVTDGVWWLFLSLCVVRDKRGMVFQLRMKHMAIRKSTEDWTGVVLDLQRIMLLSFSQPTYWSPVERLQHLLPLGELTVKPKEVLSGVGDTLVLLCDATLGAGRTRQIVVKLRDTCYRGLSADKVTELYRELTSRCAELIAAYKKKDEAANDAVSTQADDDIYFLEKAIDEIHEKLSALKVDEPKVELVLRELAEANALSMLWTLVGDGIGSADGGIVLPVVMSSSPSLLVWEGAMLELRKLMIGTVMAGHGTPLDNVCRCDEEHRKRIASAVGEQGRALLPKLHERGHALVDIHQGNVALVGDLSDANPRALFIDVESLSPIGRACGILYKMGHVELEGTDMNMISGSVDMASLTRLEARLLAASTDRSSGLSTDNIYTKWYGGDGSHV